MKIEITCPECNSTMRVDSDNAGKQARCPVCSNITFIPANRIKGDVAFDDQPADPPAPSMHSNPRTKRKVILGIDQAILIAFCLGVISIACNFLCCGPYVSLPLALVGIVYVFISHSKLKQSGFVINGIALLVGIGHLIFNYWMG